MGTNETKDPKASDVASSILRELGLNEGKRNRIEPSDFEIDKSSKTSSTSEDKANQQNQESPETASQDNLEGFRRLSLRGGYAALVGLSGFIILLIAGGYLNPIDTSLFQQLLNNRFHQIEIETNLRNRLVKNHLNREPLLVLEGEIRNLFDTTEMVSHIRLKALAFDGENNLLESQTGFAGILLDDKELKRLSKSEIQRLFESKNGREIPNKNLFWNQELPFQTVFFDTGKKINHTSVQIVSYLRKGKVVYVRSPDSET